MDAFKPLLPYEDSTIVLHIVTLLKTIGADPILMVTGHRAEELEAYLSHTGIRFLRNEAYQDTQMFDSVRMGIEAIADECEKIMLMPVDTPAIMLETFHQVMMIDADMVRTVYGGKPGHPIMLRSEIAKKLCAYMGDRGLRGAMEESGIPITSLEVDDRGVNWDVDTQEEYQKLIEWNHERGEGYPIRPLVQVRLMASEIFFGPGTAELLTNIDQTGSIQDACAAMSLSYSKGSRMIKTAEKNLGFKLLERWTGGSGGGGSRLTKEGRRILDCYQAMLERVKNCTGDIFQECFSKGFRE
jgi:molybdate transport repressor ModE-like protein